MNILDAYLQETMACSAENAKLFKQVFAEGLQPVKEIELPYRAFRMGLINGDLWLAIANKNTIQVINQEGDLVKTMAHNFNKPSSVHQASNGDIILASNYGLEIIDNDAKVVKCIKSGRFSDTSMNGDKFVALDYSRNEISIWECGSEQWKWRQIMCFKYRNGTILPKATVLYINKTVCCISDPTNNTIDEYTEDGEFTRKHTAPNANFILLCAHDVNGQFIIANYRNNSLILFQNGEFKTVDGIQGPVDAVRMPNGDRLWVLQGEPTGLIKYNIK